MVVFRRWLLRFESGRGSISGSVRSLCREYTAAHVMRLFLRRVQTKFSSAVIAGSFPAWKFLESKSLDTWRPTDIDIFLFDDNAMERVGQMYAEIVADTMKAEWESRLRHTSDLTYEGTFEDNNDGNPVIVNCTTPSAIERFDIMRALESWLRELTLPVNDAYTLQDENCIRKTPSNIPHTLQKSQYFVLYTETLQLRDSYCAASLPVNLIRIQTNRKMEDPEAGARLVCESFDMTLCCVALGKINSDLSLEPCLEFNNAFQALCSKTMRLTCYAFQCHSTAWSSVIAQMLRIQKYSARGFKWASLQSLTSIATTSTDVCVAFHNAHTKELLQDTYYNKVYLAQSRITGSFVVLKIIDMQKSMERLATMRSSMQVQDEVTFQRSMRHPFLVTCLHSFQNEDTLHLILENMRSGDVKAHAIKKGALPHKFVNNFFEHVACGLTFMHGRRLVHRDVKLENVFFRKKAHGTFTFKLGDFGFTRYAMILTGCRTLCGTLMYMAPEVAQVNELENTYGQQADVWSLGISLFMLLTGEKPYEKDDLETQIKHGQVSWSNNSLGGATFAFLLSMLTLSPSERPRMHSLFVSGMSEALGLRKWKYPCL